MYLASASQYTAAVGAGHPMRAVRSVTCWDDRMPVLRWNRLGGLVQYD